MRFEPAREPENPHTAIRTFRRAAPHVALPRYPFANHSRRSLVTQRRAVGRVAADQDQLSQRWDRYSDWDKLFGAHHYVMSGWQLVPTSGSDLG